MSFKIIVDNFLFIIGDVRFIGTTLWADFDALASSETDLARLVKNLFREFRMPVVLFGKKFWSDVINLEVLSTLRRLECLYPARPRWGTALRPIDEPVRLGQEPELAFLGGIARLALVLLLLLRRQRLPAPRR